MQAPEFTKPLNYIFLFIYLLLKTFQVFSSVFDILLTSSDAPLSARCVMTPRHSVMMVTTNAYPIKLGFVCLCLSASPSLGPSLV